MNLSIEVHTEEGRIYTFYSVFQLPCRGIIRPLNSCVKLQACTKAQNNSIVTLVNCRTIKNNFVSNNLQLCRHFANFEL